MSIKEEHLLKDGSMEDKIFNWQYGLCDKTIKKACKDLELPLFSCHMFESDKIMVLEALQNL